MRRFFRWLGQIAGVLLILAVVLAGYVFGGTSSRMTNTHYTVTLAEPATQLLDVTIIAQLGPMPFLDMFLRDPMQDGRQRVLDLKAQRSGRSLLTWQALPFLPDLVRIWNGFSTEPIIIHYRVDPRWMKGAESPRSYLGPSFGYLRGMVTLYTPITTNDLLHPDYEHPSDEVGLAKVEVILPEGWKMVSPFGSGQIDTLTANLRNAYIGLGPFSLQELTTGETPFLLGVYDGLRPERRATLSRQVPLLYQTMCEMTGFSPISHTGYWSLAVLPHDPIHGGGAGTGSLVVEDTLDLIAHEMFHWWNGETIVTSDDANWLKEGFTTYYTTKILYASGLWSNADFSQDIGRFQELLWGRKGHVPVNLVEASKRLAHSNDDRAYTQVYYGGALLAFSLDQQLKTQGKSLDMVWPVLRGLSDRVTSEDFLLALNEVGGADLTVQTRDAIYGRDVIDIKRSAGT